MAKIDAIFRMVLQEGASDLHMVTGARPMLRVQGEIRPVEYDELTEELAGALLHEILSPEQKAELEREGDVDFAYEVPDVVRLRCNVYRQMNGIAACFRLLPTNILSVKELGLDEGILRFTEFEKGIVVITGTTGSGKTSTLAAMIDHINRTQKLHILTIEDPIEYVHRSRLSLINQREIGGHSRSFHRSLRGALREDPDIILVGEMRDLETISLALTAAETGHLVLTTLHTPSAHQTVDRIIDSFPADRQEQIRTSLSECLRGVIAQKLIPRSGGAGRVPALEILACTPAIGALIRDGKTFQIPSMMQVGRKSGMYRMDDDIVRMIREGIIDAENGYRFANQKDLIRPFLEEKGAKKEAKKGAVGV